MKAKITFEFTNGGTCDVDVPGDWSNDTTPEHVIDAFRFLLETASDPAQGVQIGGMFIVLRNVTFLRATVHD